MLVPYLQSKVIAPRAHSDLVSRPRLIGRLTSSGTDVWLLSAAAGYGKTSLAMQALADLNTRTCWLSIDAADNDPVRFWTHVAASVMGPGQAFDQVLGRLSAGTLDHTADAILHFIEREGTSVTLVLDDLHEVSNPATLDVLGRIITHPPQNLRVVITTRSDPALPIARLRSHARIVEVRASDLAFTSDEALGVFSNADRTLIDSYVERTEGWATGLRMLEVSGTNDSSHRTDPVITLGLADFLATEVLRSLNPDQRLFLIETSILNELDPTLCDEVLGRPGSLTHLRELARQQIFTELVDPVDNSHKYHRLFRDFLRREADELEPARLRELHQRAALSYAKTPNASATITHALAAGDVGLALETIRANYGPYAQAGMLMTVDRWLEEYGRDRCTQDTELRMLAAWVALNTRRYDEIDHWLIAPSDDNSTPESEFNRLCVTSHRARHLGDAELALNLATEAIEVALSSPDETPEASGGYAAYSLAGQVLGVFNRDYDELCLQIAIDAANDSSIVTAYGSMALEAALSPHRHVEAEALADKALAYTTEPVLEWFHQPLASILTKSLVCFANGRLAEAQEMAKRAEHLAEMGLEPLMLTRVRCHLAILANEQGHIETSRQYLRSADAALQETSKPGALTDLVRDTRNRTRFAKTRTGADVKLSTRELAVLRLLPHGLTRKQLGEQLFVSENTIKSYLTSLRHKLGVAGRSADIVDKARRLGLLDTDTTQPES